MYASTSSLATFLLFFWLNCKNTYGVPRTAAFTSSVQTVTQMFSEEDLLGNGRQAIYIFRPLLGLIQENKSQCEANPISSLVGVFDDIFEAPGAQRYSASVLSSSRHGLVGRDTA